MKLVVGGSANDYMIRAFEGHNLKSDSLFIVYKAEVHREGDVGQ
jgi:hypothetical protein